MNRSLVRTFDCNSPILPRSVPDSLLTYALASSPGDPQGPLLALSLCMSPHQLPKPQQAITYAWDFLALPPWCPSGARLGPSF